MVLRFLTPGIINKIVLTMTNMHYCSTWDKKTQLKQKIDISQNYLPNDGQQKFYESVKTEVS